MSSCITRSHITRPEAVWISGDATSRERLDKAVYLAIGNTEINSKNNLNGLPQIISKIAVDYLEVYPCFGEWEWATLCGRVDPVPPLPHSFSAIWNGSCPIFPEKKIRDTHMLVYIPAKVDGEPLTLKKLGEIAKRFFPQNAEGYGYIWGGIVDELGDKPIEKSHWVLMTKKVLPKSKGKSYTQIVAELAEKSLSYEVPEILEAAVCILAQYFNSKTRLFKDKPMTFIRCKEEVEGFGTILGGFERAGLRVGLNFVCRENLGVAALLKF